MTPKQPHTETDVQGLIRIDAAAATGAHLMRNNNGAAKTADGRQIRFGLGNDSKQINKVLKFPDLIGFTPHIVRLEDVGRTLGVFTGVEVKKPAWHYTNTPHEVAQRAAIALILQAGGIAGFAASVDDYTTIHRRFLQ